MDKSVNTETISNSIHKKKIIIYHKVLFIRKGCVRNHLRFFTPLVFFHTNTKKTV